MNSRIEIGNRIAQLRKEAGLSQFGLSARSGVGQSHIAHIERGHYNVGIDTLSKLADALGCTVDFINKNKVCP